jgi:hypothetical protein
MSVRDRRGEMGTRKGEAADVSIRYRIPACATFEIRDHSPLGRRHQRLEHLHPAGATRPAPSISNRPCPGNCTPVHHISVSTPDWYIATEGMYFCTQPRLQKLVQNAHARIQSFLHMPLLKTTHHCLSLLAMASGMSPARLPRARRVSPARGATLGVPQEPLDPPSRATPSTGARP